MGEKKFNEKDFESLLSVTQPQDLMFVGFTSGSTGIPKGIPIPDQKWLRQLKVTFGMRLSDPLVNFSFCPLAHNMDRLQHYATVANGGRIGFASGDMNKLIDEIHAVQPTSLVAPPRFWDTIYKDYCLMLGKSESEASPNEKDEAGEKVRHKLSRRLKNITTGGAATSPEVMAFMSRSFPCHMGESYGASEVGAITIDSQLASDVSVRLESVPEMGYTVDDKPYPRGQILVKTPTMISGYFRDPTTTKKSFTTDGYFISGDIGMQIGRNQFKVIDRIKNVFKMSQGEFIAPEPLENKFLQSSLLQQIFVYGQSKYSFLTAVVVLSTAGEALRKERPSEIVPKILADLKRIALQEQLESFEVPRDLIISDQPFTSENGQLTGTLKKNRTALEKAFREQLEGLYQSDKKPDPYVLFVNQIRKQYLLLNNNNQNNNQNNNNQNNQNNNNQNNNNNNQNNNNQNNNNQNNNNQNNNNQNSNNQEIIELTLEDLALDSLALIHLINLLAKEFQTRLSADWLVQNKPTPNQVALKLLLGTSQEEAQKDVLWEEEYNPRLVDEILLTEPVCPEWKTPEKVFLTGATGFLGFFLTKQILETTEASVILLIRAGSTIEAAERFRKTAEFYLVPNLKNSFSNRIEFVCGDLTQKQLGLDEKSWEHIAKTANLVMHVGAVVTTAFEYRTLKKANVDSTLEMLKLANFVKVKRGIFGTMQGVMTETTPVPKQPLFLSGYSQSKVVCEHLLGYARTKKRFPLLVFRPGDVAGCSESGALNKMDFIVRMMAGFCQLGCAPLAKTEFDMTPVDFVARMMICVAFEHTFSDADFVFHFVSKKAAPVQELVAGLNAAQLFAPIQACDFAEFKNKLSHQPTNPAHPFLTTYFRSGAFPGSMAVSNPTTAAWLLQQGQRYEPPEISPDLIAKYAQFIKTAFF